MGISLSQIKSTTASGVAVIKGQDEELKIGFTYYPNRVTTDLVMKFDANEVELIDVIVECLASWDIVNDDGTDLPTDKESVKQIPVAMLGEIAEALLSTQKGDSGEVGGSFDNG